jgi:hypothetical protein
VTDRKPPPWGGDPLSAFFSDAEHNDRVTALNFPAVYALLQRVDADFRRAEEALRYIGRQELLVSQFLMVRTHSSFLGGIRLAMSGQLSESYVVLRHPSGPRQTAADVHASPCQKPQDDFGRPWRYSPFPAQRVAPSRLSVRGPPTTHLRLAIDKPLPGLIPALSCHA